MRAHGGERGSGRRAASVFAMLAESLVERAQLVEAARIVEWGTAGDDDDVVDTRTEHVRRGQRVLPAHRPADRREPIDAESSSSSAHVVGPVEQWTVRADRSERPTPGRSGATMRTPEARAASSADAMSSRHTNPPWQLQRRPAVGIAVGRSTRACARPAAQAWSTGAVVTVATLQVQSGIQLPWKPKGTRARACGREPRAHLPCRPRRRSRARIRSVSRSVTKFSSQPSSSPSRSGSGANTGFAGHVRARRSRAPTMAPVCRSWRATSVNANRLAPLRRARHVAVAATGGVPVVETREVAGLLVARLVGDAVAIEVDRPPVQRAGVGLGQRVVAEGHRHAVGPATVRPRSEDRRRNGPSIRRGSGRRRRDRARTTPASVTDKSRGSTPMRAGSSASHRIGTPPAEQRLEIEHGRQVEEDHVIVGHDEVVHHHRPRQLDVDRSDQRARRVGHVEPEIGRDRAVTEEEQLAGGRVPLRVRGHRPRRAGRRSRTRRSSPRSSSQLRWFAGFHQREIAIGVADDVRVRRVLHEARLGHDLGWWHDELAEAAEHGTAFSLFDAQAGALDEAVAVRRAPVAQLDGVDHPVAVEQVVAAQRWERRVRAVAHVDALQGVGDPSFDLEVIDHELVADGSRTRR